jgi:hypothetical protein
MHCPCVQNYNIQVIYNDTLENFMYSVGVVEGGGQEAKLITRPSPEL